MFFQRPLSDDDGAPTVVGVAVRWSDGTTTVETSDRYGRVRRQKYKDPNTQEPVERVDITLIRNAVTAPEAPPTPPTLPDPITGEEVDAFEAMERGQTEYVPDPPSNHA